MDITKLEGIASAVEAEAAQPFPSHANLARLTAMFFRELIRCKREAVIKAESHGNSGETIEEAQPISPAPEAAAPKKRVVKKKA